APPVPEPPRPAEPPLPAEPALLLPPVALAPPRSPPEPLAPPCSFSALGSESFEQATNVRRHTAAVRRPISRTPVDLCVMEIPTFGADCIVEISRFVSLRMAPSGGLKKSAAG